MDLHRPLYSHLKQLARRRRMTTYGEIAPIAGVDLANRGHRTRLCHMLAAISTAEAQQGRPMLSALVVGKGRQTPGAGFFKLARKLGRHSGSDDSAFYSRELQRVFEAHDFHTKAKKVTRRPQS